ncbi:MAG: LacI family DNA-binding transcriptional regulator [Tenericutes bacterium]|jgi:LacI family transcriptional regulator|nr:LacI family DNA-binding transcriptional regulator [Mycoplasmatota bacterium]
MANIKDVANKAGVGIATVSRVINNSGYVKKETRDKIEKVIKDIGYVPNEIARSMTKQQTNIIAFILPNSSHIFFSELLYHVENELYEHGYKLMVCNSASNLDKELDYISMLNKNRVDGIIFLTSSDIEKYLNPSLPIISFDRHFKTIPFVASDNYHGGRLAAEVLLHTNPKRMLFIGDDAQGELSSITTEVSKRRIGFSDYLKEKGFKNLKIIEYPQGSEYIPEKFIRELIQDNLDFDAIFAISDILAHIVIETLEKNGRRVPEDVKVIGYDGVNSYLNLGKQISSIKQPVKSLAKVISDSILKRIQGDPVESTILPVIYKSGDTV